VLAFMEGGLPCMPYLIYWRGFAVEEGALPDWGASTVHRLLAIRLQ
jgi:hypothetical protein